MHVRARMRTIGDNIVMPGAPDYKDYLLNGTGRAQFDTTVHPSQMEYSTAGMFYDEVLVSLYK